MSSDEKKNWGTIFLDAARESSLSKLDAMQAASRQQQWNQKTQQDYLERVRQKAIDRAREILGEAYAERQKVLDEAARDADRIRNEAKAAYASADEIRNQTQVLRHSVQEELDTASHIRAEAKEEGFQFGLTAAQEELDKFRAAMGTSVAAILQAIDAQCMNIFEGWRTELVDLLKICVEKGTGLALSERHDAILRKMILEAVRNLDDRRMVTLRVHPDDEDVVADLFSAAKEKNPDLGHWRIAPDGALELGDIIAESQTGTVDSRLQLYREMVDNILRHLVIPPTALEEEAKVNINNTLEDVIQRVMSITPAAAPSTHSDAQTHETAAEPAPDNEELLHEYVQQAQQDKQALLDDILTQQEQTPSQSAPEQAYAPSSMQDLQNSPEELFAEELFSNVADPTLDPVQSQQLRQEQHPTQASAHASAAQPFTQPFAQPFMQNPAQPATQPQPPVEPFTLPPVEPYTPPRVEPQMQPHMGSHVQSHMEPLAQPQVEPPIQPQMQPQFEPQMQAPVEPSEQTQSDPSMQFPTEYSAEYSAEPQAELLPETPTEDPTPPAAKAKAKAAPQPMPEPSMEELEEELLPIDFEDDAAQNFDGGEFLDDEFLGEEFSEDDHLEDAPMAALPSSDLDANSNHEHEEIYDLGTPFVDGDTFAADPHGDDLNNHLDVIDLTNPIIKGKV